MLLKRIFNSFLIAVISFTLMSLEVSFTSKVLGQTSNPAINQAQQQFQNQVQGAAAQNALQQGQQAASGAVNQAQQEFRDEVRTVQDLNNGSQNPSTQSQDEPATTVDGVAVTKAADKDGNVVETRSASTTDTASQLQTADFLTLVTMLAMGLIAATLVRYQPLALDMMIAMAGGVIYIGGEITAIFSAQEEITDKDFTVSSDGSGNAQTEAIQKEIQSYESIKDASETKFMLQTASAVTFAGAAVAAYMAETKWQAAAATCWAAIASNSVVPLCVPIATSISTTLAAKEPLRQTPMPSCIKMKQLGALLAKQQAELTAAGGSGVCSGIAAVVCQRLGFT